MEFKHDHLNLAELDKTMMGMLSDPSLRLSRPREPTLSSQRRLPLSSDKWISTASSLI
jgi:hypothetical protein